jgi:exosortase/archaeosortase
LLAGSVLSLVFSYIPGLNTWFAGKAPEFKRLFMLGLLVLVAAAVYGVACLGYGSGFGINVTCDQAGAIALFQALILAIIANQSVYAVTPKTGAVQEARKDSAFEALAE